MHLTKIIRWLLLTLLFVVELSFTHAQSWKIINNGRELNTKDETLFNIVQIARINDSTVVALGTDFRNYPKIIMTTDTGRTWKIKFYDPNIRKLGLPLHLEQSYGDSKRTGVSDQNTYFMSCMFGFILVTTDAGTTWNILSVSDSTTAQNEMKLNDVYVEPSGNRIVCVRRLETVNTTDLYSSTDGGQTWGKITKNKFDTALDTSGNKPSFESGLGSPTYFSSDKIYGLIQYSDKIAVAPFYITRQSKIAQTTNGGVSWQFKRIPIDTTFFTQFISPSVGYAHRSYSEILTESSGFVIVKTTTAGDTWDTIYHNRIVDTATNNSEYNSTNGSNLYFQTEKLALALGSDFLMISRDGAKSWEGYRREINPQDKIIERYRSGAFINERTVFAATNNGVIVRLDLPPPITNIDHQDYTQTHNKLWPNPVSGNSITAELPFTDLGDCTMTVSDITGRQYTSLAIQRTGNKCIIDVSVLPNGMYSLEITMRNYSQVLPFIISR